MKSKLDCENIAVKLGYKLDDFGNYWRPSKYTKDGIERAVFRETKSGFVIDEYIENFNSLDWYEN